VSSVMLSESLREGHDIRFGELEGNGGNFAILALKPDRRNYRSQLYRRAFEPVFSEGQTNGPVPVIPSGERNAIANHVARAA
jgi:hypothetical protein